MSAFRSSGPSLPPAMVKQSLARIRGLSLTITVVFLVLPLAKSMVEGNIATELTDPAQWVPLALIAVTSGIMYTTARSRRLPAKAVLQGALAWEVLVALGLAFAQHWGAFRGVDPQTVTFDTVGISLVGIWMIVFTVIVPVRPRAALVALTLSGATPALAWVASDAAGMAPPLQPVQAFFVLVFPYLVAGAAAWLAARTIYQLGTDLRAAQQLGSYHLEQRLGRGGMGEVWQARHRLLARPAAVKLIRADTLGRDPQDLLQAAERFEREAQATAGLRSPHTVELYDFGATEDGTLYYVMELLDGMDLGTLVERHGPTEPARVVHVLRQCCDSLAEAHARGLVHRDIKPSNIVLCRYGLQRDFVKVLDFGLVKDVATSGDTGLTKQGTVAGTPAFMPPEVAMGRKDIDGRADLYALGCVAYWLLTGQLVFEAETPMGIALSHVNDDPIPPSRRTEVPVPSDLEAVILACLAKDPADRPAGAAALAEHLDALALAGAWTPARAAQWWHTHLPSPESLVSGS